MKKDLLKFRKLMIRANILTVNELAERCARSRVFMWRFLRGKSTSRYCSRRVARVLKIPQKRLRALLEEQKRKNKSNLINT